VIDLSNSVAYDVALRCAESVHYHHKDYTTVDDLYQSAWEYLLRHPVMWSQFEEAEDRVMAERTLDRIVMDHLRGIARREKAERSGYHVDDECTYSPKVIAELLPMTFAIESALLPAAASDDAPGRGGNPHGQGDFVASLLDVRNAWITTAFRGDEARLIEARFVDDMSVEHIAASFSTTPDEVKKQLARGLRRMVERLGGLPSRGCPGDCECREVP
jgi:DNA-directed RNA polymerase specialized sigma24 family protein